MRELGLHRICKWGEILIIGALAACFTVDVGSSSSLSNLNAIALMPMANYSETHDAAQQTYRIAQHVLQKQGFIQIYSYDQNASSHVLTADKNALSRTGALEWAKK